MSISVRIQAFELEVEIQSTESHPDHLDDICNRAVTAFKKSVETMKLTGVSLYDPEFNNEDEDEL